MRKILSEREEELPGLVIGKLLKIAVESKDIISLGPGEPDFISPPNVIKGAKRGLDCGCTHYSPVRGRKDLLELLAKKVKKNNKIDAGVENITTCTGSTEGLLLALMCTIDPGECVMMTDPGFLAYRPMVELLNGLAIPVPLYEREGWQPTMERMRGRIVPGKTNVMIINSPCNPTGVVYTKKTLEEIADFAVDNDLLILSDEAYESLVYGGAKHVSIGSLNGLEDRTVSLFSFSKTYAMAGFRLGYAVGPEDIIKAMVKIKPFTTLASPTVSQIAALNALRGSQKCVKDMRNEYDRRRELVKKRLNELDLPFVEPMGAFYAFPKIYHYGMRSLKFSEWMLKNGKVAVMPGTEFGKGGEGYIRISYATDYKLIEKAFNRMERALKVLRPQR